MRYVEYGATGKQVSVIGFGGMRFDQTRPDPENAELVRYASASGINYFDTAPGYGRSEDIFGLAFKDMPHPWYVSTKAMPTTFDTADKARDAVRKSLDRMHLAKIHFFHVWCLRKMEHYELAMRPGGLYDGLLRCRDEGLIEHIAFSSHQPGSEIRHIVDSGKFEGVLLGVNILNFPYRWEGIEAAHKAGLAVVAMNPLGGGLVPQYEKQLAFLAPYGKSPIEAALRFLVACPQISVALVGFTNREHVDIACRVGDHADPLTDSDLAAIRKHLSENMNRACTGCGYCAGCPQHIPVASYMQYYNEKAIFGKPDDDMKKRLDFQHNWGLLVGRKASAGDCSECRECEEACTQHLDIVARLREMAAWEREFAAAPKK